MQVVYEPSTFISIQENEIKLLLDELNCIMGYTDVQHSVYVEELIDALSDWTADDG